LSDACFSVRRLFHILNIDTLRIIYFAYFQSVIKYGIIFWENSTNADQVFILQKRIIKIMAGVGARSSCRSLFKKPGILPVPRQYILSLMMFVVDSMENFHTNSTIHDMYTRNHT
jgi:hypothetical protein